MAQTIAFSLSKKSYDYVMKKSNMSGYVNKLIEDDIGQAQSDECDRSISELTERGKQRDYSLHVAIWKRKGLILPAAEYLRLLDDKQAYLKRWKEVNSMPDVAVEVQEAK